MKLKLKILSGKVKYIFCILFSRFLPLKANTVFFDSFGGQYNDNPKYISKKLHLCDSSINIVWTYSDHGKDDMPEYAQKVLHKSCKYYSYINRATVVVDNYTGLRNFGFMNCKCSVIEKFIKRKNQLCISTWHGTPLKKIGKDILHKNYDDYLSCTDYCVAGCKYTADILERVYNFKNKMKLYGTPRNDILFSKNIDVNKLKEKLHLPLNKRIILFAPTFRESVDFSGVVQFKMMNIKKILKKTSERFNEEFVFVFRVHHSVLEKINNEKLIEGYGGIVYDGNLGDDMAEYLLCSDILITDYSGSLFDFALTYKPCFLFAPDRANYEKVERGFYLDYDSLPFTHAKNNEELIKNISSFSEIEYKNKLKLFLDKVGNVEDGNASQRIVDDILSFLESGKIR